MLTLHTKRGDYFVVVGGAGELDVTLVSADAARPESAETPRGWYAPFYSDRQPALSLAAAVTAESVQFWTLFTPDPARWVAEVEQHLT